MEKTVRQTLPLSFWDISLPILLTVYSLACIRMFLYSVLSGSQFDFVFTYFGVSLFSAILLLFKYHEDALCNLRFSLLILFYLIGVTVFDLLVMREWSFYAFKLSIVYNKANQTVFISYVVYLAWKRFFNRDYSLAVKAFIYVLVGVIVFNWILIATYGFNFIKDLDYSFIVNNKASMELVAFMAGLLAIARAGRLYQETLLLFGFIVLMTIITYSTRAAMIGYIAVMVASLIVFKKSSVAFKLCSCALLVIACLGIYDASGPQLVQKLLADNVFHENAHHQLRAATNKSYKFALSKDDLSKKSVRRTIKFAQKLSDFTVDGDGNVSGNDKGTSLFVRIFHIVNGVLYFVDYPLGVGMVQVDNIRIGNTKNHTLWLKLLNSYGVFYLIYAIIFIFIMFPRYPIWVWIPLLMTMWFAAQVHWFAFLPIAALKEKVITGNATD